MANFESIGDPLTGTPNSTDGDDTYLGRYLGDSPYRPAIIDLKLTDLRGASALTAENVLALAWSPVGIASSFIKLGDERQVITVEVIGNGYTRGIAGTNIELGSGSSLTEVSVSTGTTNDNRAQSGIESSN